MYDVGIAAPKLEFPKPDTLRDEITVPRSTKCEVGKPFTIYNIQCTMDISVPSE